MAAGADAATLLGVDRTSVSFLVHLVEIHTCLIVLPGLCSQATMLCSSISLLQPTHWCETPFPPPWASPHHMSVGPSALLRKSLMHFFPSPGCHVYSGFSLHWFLSYFCSAIIHRRGCRQQTSGEIYADWALKTLWWIIFPLHVNLRLLIHTDDKCGPIQMHGFRTKS